MELQLKNKTFLITGASSGLGKAVAIELLNEGANIIAFARDTGKLNDLIQLHHDRITCINGDVLNSADIQKLANTAIDKKIDGVFINAGGPPAKPVIETTINDWDDGYKLVVRWKIELVQKLIPFFKTKKQGRIIFNESVSIKQPIPNLALSNSLRLAIVGYAKTLSQEVAKDGITLNILAPGYHDTDALNRIFNKKAEQLEITPNEAKQLIVESIPVQKLGQPDNYASLATWLFSDQASYITGQTISIDGGVMQGVFG